MVLTHVLGCISLYALKVLYACFFLCEANAAFLVTTSLSLSPSLLLSPVFSQGPCVEGVTMYSLLVAVVLLATAANNNRGQSTKGAWGGGNVPVGMYSIRFP